MSNASSGSGSEGESDAPSGPGSLPIALIGLLLLVVLIATNMKC